MELYFFKPVNQIDEMNHSVVLPLISILFGSRWCLLLCSQLLWAPNFLSFKGVPSPLLRFFRGYFHPLFINLEGIIAGSKLLNLHKTWV